MPADCLSPRDRLAFYREQAEEALRQATATTDPTIRSGLLNIAAAWRRLIRETETLLADPVTVRLEPLNPPPNS